MALRSSLSNLNTKPRAPREVNLDDDAPEQTETETEQEAAVSAPARGSVAAPAADEPPVRAPAPKKRGRRKMTPEEKAERAAKRAEAKKQAAALEQGVPDDASPTELRTHLRAVEGSIKELRQEMQAEMGKFEPQIKDLTAQHADISAKLASALLSK